MPSRHTEKTREYVRDLRINQTRAEDWLWRVLRGSRFSGVKFRRQVSIGPFIVDFYCHEKKLVIELDGGQHNSKENLVRDAERSKYLARHGLVVIRFWNNEVFQQKDAVLTQIWQTLHQSREPPNFADGKAALTRFCQGKISLSPGFAAGEGFRAAIVKLI